MNGALYEFLPMHQILDHNKRASIFIVIFNMWYVEHPR